MARTPAAWFVAVVGDAIGLGISYGQMHVSPSSCKCAFAKSEAAQTVKDT